jgi:hypothetical protein
MPTSGHAVVPRMLCPLHNAIRRHAIHHKQHLGMRKVFQPVMALGLNSGTNLIVASTSPQ